ncbi:hypothetical protein GF374_02890 [Candidatus Woesearchaeota archaeon]|nr:hypothetical protein [Candidatus Woesearchaeota archaeon]
MLKGLSELSKVIEESYTNIEKPIYIGTIFHDPKEDEVKFTFGEFYKLIITSPKYHIRMSTPVIEIQLKPEPLRYCAKRLEELGKSEEEQSELLIEADKYKEQADLLKGTNSRLVTPDGRSTEFRKHWLDEPYEYLYGPWNRESGFNDNNLYIYFDKKNGHKQRIVASKEEFIKWVNDIMKIRTRKLEKLIKEVKKY